MRRFFGRLGTSFNLGSAVGFALGSWRTASAGGPTGNGILLEDGTSFLLAEDGSYLILEQ